MDSSFDRPPERWFPLVLVGVCLYGEPVSIDSAMGPSGIAFAWTASYFLLMFPGFWYAGKANRARYGAGLAVIWKFFAASVGAGVGTLLIFKAMPYFAGIHGVAGAFVRMVAVSLVFLLLYLAAVIALTGG